MTQNKLLQLWLKKLTSGKYKQTKQHLRDDHGYCCLGVLCEAYRELGGKLKRSRDEDDKNMFSYNGETGCLPPQVQAAIGFTSENGSYKSRRPRCLSQDNDSGNKTFQEIAAIIKSKPTGLFIKG